MRKTPDTDKYPVSAFMCIYILQQIAVFTHIQFFDRGGQEHVTYYCKGEPCEIDRGKGSQAQKAAQWGKGDCGDQGYACKGEERYSRRGPALDKGDFRRSYHMYYESLAPHGFHKPARLECGDVKGLS